MFGLVKRDKWIGSLNILLSGLLRIEYKRMQHDFMDSTPFYPISYPPTPLDFGQNGMEEVFFFVENFKRWNSNFISFYYIEVFSTHH